MSATLPAVLNPLAVEIVGTTTIDIENKGLEIPITKYSFDWIDFGATGEKEVYQNVKFIVLTPIRSVVLDREFGMDFIMVDKPIPIAELMLSQEVSLKITAYEPRCYFQNIEYIEDNINGWLKPDVTIIITSKNELPSMYPTAEGIIQPMPFVSPIQEIEFRGTLSGTEGKEGPPGKSATIQVGTTTTTEPGTDADVVNVGDTTDAIFDFYIPRGDKGEEGTQGIDGIPAYTFCVQDFVVPAVGETVEVDCEEIRWVAVGEFLYIDGAAGEGQAGALKVVEKIGNVLTLLNPPSS
jgi:phage baseplate assembly protein W